MPETDILNPTPIWTEDIQDSMCPDYGFDVNDPLTDLMVKPCGGYPYTRAIDNHGHAFQLSWIDRSFACVQRVKRYYHQYRSGGYFTIVDWDGGGRHYVGRFTGAPHLVQRGNGTWSIQGLPFEEIPTVPMVQYPSDWDNDAVTAYATADNGDQLVAGNGAFAINVRTILGNPVTTFDDPGTPGDWAQLEYVGYGFRLFLMSGPEFGQASVQVDGTIVTPDNGSSSLIECYAAADVGPQMLCQVQNLSRDFHRVKLVPLGTKTSAAPATTVSWHSLQVMR